jgi:outer membrane protein insertion porin family
VKISQIFFLVTLFIFQTYYSTGSLLAQDGPRTYRIVSVSAEGNRLYDSKTIISNSGLEIGSEIAFPSDETNEAINRLWNLKLFSDVQIVVDKKIGNDAYIIIRVKELPRLSEIKYIGNDEFSDKDLEEIVGLAEGQVISPQMVKDIEYNITKKYIEEGYSLAVVKVDQFVNASNEAQLRIKITEGEEVSVMKIRFEGNKHISSSDLRGAMDETSEKIWWKFWDNAEFNKKKYEDDKKLIIDLYQEKGFKDAVITGDTFTYSTDKEAMTIKIKIDEGPRYSVNNITFQGNKVYPDSVLKERLDFKRGDVYNKKKFEMNLRGNEDQTDLASLYLDNGYLGFQADVEEKDAGNNRLDLVIHISENRQYRIGIVSIEGNQKTQDKVIRRELYTLPGQYFNRANLIRSIQNLQNLNYFNPEKLSYDFTQRNDSTVDMIYKVEERSSDQLNASIGWSQTFGVSGSIGLVFNNFDIFDPLSGGAGQILSFQWDFGTSGTYRTFSLGFTEPWFLDTPTLIGISLFDSKQNYTYEIRETGVTLSLGRRFRFPDDYFRGDWYLKLQRTDVIYGAGIYETGVRSQVSIGQIITRNSTNSPIFPSFGSKVVISSELAGANVIGNISFFKQGFQAEAYNNLDNLGKFVLYTNFQFEGVTSLASDNYIPPNEFLYMGGNGLAYNTIALRGYDDRTIGPIDNGSYVGGRVLIKYGLELRYSISLDPIPIYVLAFAEAGNVWAKFKDLNPLDLRRSVGFGTRLILPAVGMIGFDLGYGFDRKIVDGNEPALLFHFQFGRGF